MTDETADNSERIPAHPPTPQGFATQAPQRLILMSPHMAAIGGLLAFFSVVLMVVVLPTVTYNPPPSRDWLPLTNQQLRGREVYIANGCMYCHSGFSRPQDTFTGLYYLYTRPSEPGDYHGIDQSPNLLGSERTGPDLSQEGGHHPDDWHIAHYWNPRSVNPFSIMPRFSFFTPDDLAASIAFNQSSGGKEAVLRTAAQHVAKQLMLINMGKVDPPKAFPDLVQQLSAQGAYRPNGQAMDASPWGMPWQAVWMVNTFERGYWLTVDPLPVTPPNLTRGKEIFLERCSGCHGVKGDGKGPAAQFLMPPPFDFTDTTATGIRGPFASDGQLYHRILTAGKGTAMENFGTRLSVEDIWRVVLFLRTIQNGSLRSQDVVPTPEMYLPYTPPPPLRRYVQNHPLEAESGPIRAADDPFMAAARWISPGLADGDEVLVGGKLPMNLQRIAALVRATYLANVEQAYSDGRGRGEALPPRSEILDTTGITFYAP